ncbi:hypothetical protein [Cyanobium sp. L1E-Cus]|uniref:hypothetical protein n=1 Tax=Cyanobium sp. L1E-Cus TaxID=2823714 RepID=UPI0020CD97BD|nr:hypothetical protein [Cyanobium sp. L1E-Cus]MCP9823604.1 hypothetical protein [Cyanobium sp. L1E-Cus]
MSLLSKRTRVISRISEKNMSSFAKQVKVVQQAVLMYTLTSYWLPLMLFLAFGQSEIYKSIRVESVWLGMLSVFVLSILIIFTAKTSLVNRLSWFFLNMAPSWSLARFAKGYSFILALLNLAITGSGLSNSYLLGSRYTGEAGQLAHFIIGIGVISSTCSTLYFLYLYGAKPGNNRSILLRLPLFLSLLLQMQLISGVGAAVRLLFIFAMALFPRVTARVLFTSRITLRIPSRLTLSKKVVISFCLLLLAVPFVGTLVLKQGLLAKNTSMNQAQADNLQIIAQGIAPGQYVISRSSTAFYSISNAVDSNLSTLSSHPDYNSLLASVEYRLGVIMGDSRAKKSTPTPDGLNALAIGEYNVDPMREGTSPGVYAFWLYLLKAEPMLAIPLSFVILTMCSIVFSLLLVYIRKAAMPASVPNLLLILLYSRILAVLLFASPGSLFLIVDDSLILFVVVFLFILLLPGGPALPLEHD